MTDAGRRRADRSPDQEELQVYDYDGTRRAR